MTNQEVFDQTTGQPPAGISWGNFAIVVVTILLLLGVTFIKKPELFSAKEKKYSAADYANTPSYYAYVEPAAVPQVAGANTNDGPSVINEDGTVSQAGSLDMGAVLGASTQDVELSLDKIKVKIVADSQPAIKKYFVDTQNLEAGPVDNAGFEAALSSNNQKLIDLQAEKINAIKVALENLTVPQGLVTLHKLKIIHYSAAVAILNNFTQADNNPELVGSNLQQFLKSQQDLDSELSLAVKKYNINPSEFNLVLADVPAPQNQNINLSNGAQ